MSQHKTEHSDSDVDHDRYAKQRAQFLERRHKLTEKQAKSVAYSELGYSDAGIAKRVESTKGTVTSYLDEIVEQYGETVAWPKPADERELDAALTDHPDKIVVYKCPVDGCPKSYRSRNEIVGHMSGWEEAHTWENVVRGPDTLEVAEIYPSEL